MTQNPYTGSAFADSWQSGFDAGFNSPDEDHSAPTPLDLDQQTVFAEGVLAGQEAGHGLQPAAHEPTNWVEKEAAAQAVARIIAELQAQGRTTSAKNMSNDLTLPFKGVAALPPAGDESTSLFAIGNLGAGIAMTGVSAGFPSSSSPCVGVLGISQALPGIPGVQVVSYGVHGESTVGDGVHGESPSGHGVFGTSPSGEGVHGESQSGRGVFGTSATGEGVHAETNSTQFAAIAGVALNVTNQAAAVFGQHQGRGPGVFGTSKGGGEGVVGEGLPGVEGRSDSGVGVEADSNRGTALVATTHGGSETAFFCNQWGSGNIMVGRDANNAEVFRVRITGDVQVRGVNVALVTDIQQLQNEIQGLSEAINNVLGRVAGLEAEVAALESE